MTVKFTLIKNDLRVFTSYSRKHLPGTKQRRVAILLIISALGAHYAYITETEWFYRVSYFVGFMGITLLVAWVFGFVLRRITEAVSFRPEHQQGVLCEHTITLTDDAITEVTPLNESKILWSGFRSVIDAPEHIYIFMTGSEAHVIPKRAFADRDAERAFYTRATQLFSHARTNATQIS